MVSDFARRLVLGVVVGLCMFAAGCGGQITKGSFDKISTGMTEQQVTDILGSPTESAEVNMPDFASLVPGKKPAAMPDMPKLKQAIWKGGNKVITVQFLNGKVANKGAFGL